MSELDPIQRAVEAQQPQFVLHIVVTKDGQLNVNGPIQNEVLCLRILAGAMKAVTEFNKKRPAIEIPGVAVPPNLRGNGH